MCRPFARGSLTCWSELTRPEPLTGVHRASLLTVGWRKSVLRGQSAGVNGHCTNWTVWRHIRLAWLWCNRLLFDVRSWLTRRITSLYVHGRWTCWTVWMRILLMPMNDWTNKSGQLSARRFVCHRRRMPTNERRAFVRLVAVEQSTSSCKRLCGRRRCLGRIPREPGRTLYTATWLWTLLGYFVLPPLSLAFAVG